MTLEQLIHDLLELADRAFDDGGVVVVSKSNERWEVGLAARESDGSMLLGHSTEASASAAVTECLRKVLRMLEVRVEGDLEAVSRIRNLVSEVEIERIQRDTIRDEGSC